MSVVEQRKSTAPFLFQGTKTDTVIAPVSGSANGNVMNLLEEMYGILCVQIVETGDPTGDVVFEATIDGTNWIAVQGVDVSDHTSFDSTISTPPNSIWRLDVSGFYKFRARIASIASGDVVVWGIGQSA